MVPTVRDATPPATGKRVPGATTYYTLHDTGAISVRQGDDRPYAYVRYAADDRPVLGACYLFTYPDGGVYFHDGAHEYYTVERDNLAYPIDWREHEKRRDAPRYPGYSPMSWD